MNTGRLLVSALLGATVALVVTGCASAIPQSVGAARYQSVSIAGDPAVQKVLDKAPVRVWFEQGQGELDMIAMSPVNVYTVPVSFHGSTVVPDVGQIRGTLEGCVGASPSCTVEGWFSAFVTKRLTYTVSGADLQLSRGDVKLQLRKV